MMEGFALLRSASSATEGIMMSSSGVTHFTWTDPPESTTLECFQAQITGCIQALHIQETEQSSILLSLYNTVCERMHENIPEGHISHKSTEIRFT